MDKQRKTRLIASIIVGAVLGLASCMVQTTVPDAIFHTITSFIIYFFITYLLVWIGQAIFKKRGSGK
jgi:uncharacterized membrane protein YeaQ/YmgE (transglycosylase-associated protein family)